MTSKQAGCQHGKRKSVCDDDRGQYFIECPDCGLRGPGRGTELHAWEAWRWMVGSPEDMTYLMETGFYRR